MMPRDTRVHEPKIAIGAAAEQGDRGGELERALAGGVVLGGDEQPRPAPEHPLADRHVGHRVADLVLLHGGPADHPRPDPEQAHRQVVGGLEPHPDRPDERVALLLGVLPGEVRELLAEAVRVHLQALTIGDRQLDHEVVRHERAALRDDRGPLVHLPLDGAGHLDRLEIRFERPRKGPFNQAFEPALEALEDSHRMPPFLPRWSRPLQYGTEQVRTNRRIVSGFASTGRYVLTFAGSRQAAKFHPGKWRNGRRARFRSVCLRTWGFNSPLAHQVTRWSDPAGFSFPASSPGVASLPRLLLRVLLRGPPAPRGPAPACPVRPAARLAVRPRPGRRPGAPRVPGATSRRRAGGVRDPFEGAADRRIRPVGQNGTATARFAEAGPGPGRGRARRAPAARAPRGSRTGPCPAVRRRAAPRSEEHTSELQSRENLVCRLLLEKKKNTCRYKSRNL